MPADLMPLLLTGAAAVGLAVATGVVVPALVRRASRHSPVVLDLVRAAVTPFRVLLLVVALNAVAAGHRPSDTDGVEVAAHGLRIVGLVNGVWLLAVVVLFLVDGAVRRADAGLDPRNARRLRTQAQVARRVIVAAFVVIALAAVLLTFDGVRAVGASLLASAGLVSVVAALAAQSTLGNLFAGLQLAFSDAIRLDDVVIVDGEYGTIEEITLSYVVVKAWDDRRIVLPCTYFTTTPFQNWTRRDTEMMGTVELDVDWRVDVDQMRAELARVLGGTALYNGRSSGLVVTDATGGLVRTRVSITADDPGALWELQCHVRERLVAWMREAHPDALPRTRVDVEASRSVQPLV